MRCRLPLLCLHAGGAAVVARMGTAAPRFGAESHDGGKCGVGERGIARRVSGAAGRLGGAFAKTAITSLLGLLCGWFVPLQVFKNGLLDQMGSFDSERFTQRVETVKNLGAQPNVDLLGFKLLGNNLFAHQQHGGESYQGYAKKIASAKLMIAFDGKCRISLCGDSALFTLDRSQIATKRTPPTGRERCDMVAQNYTADVMQRLDFWATISRLGKLVERNAAATPVHLAYAKIEAEAEHEEAPKYATMMGFVSAFKRLSDAEQRQIVNGWTLAGGSPSTAAKQEKMKGMQTAESIRDFLCLEYREGESVPSVAQREFRFDEQSDAAVRVQIMEGTSKADALAALKAIGGMIVERWPELVGNPDVMVIDGEDFDGKKKSGSSERFVVESGERCAHQVVKRPDNHWQCARCDATGVMVDGMIEWTATKKSGTSSAPFVAELGGNSNGKAVAMTAA